MRYRQPVSDPEVVILSAVTRRFPLLLIVVSILSPLKITHNRRVDACGREVLCSCSSYVVQWLFFSGVVDPGPRVTKLAEP